MVYHLKEIDSFLKNNLNLSNECLEQPFLNVYLYRKKIYNTRLNGLVSHNGYNIDSFDGIALHFAGGPGNFKMKYYKMSNYYQRNQILKMNTFNTRDELLTILNKNIKVCEIGVFKGEFSQVILDVLHPLEFHLIDIFDGQMCSGDKDGNNIIWTDLSDEYNSLCDKYKDNENIFIHKGFSYNILALFENDYFDMIYIDGDHSYSGVKKDLEISYSKIKKGGYIFGHDYIASRFEGVVRAVNEFCQEKQLNIEYLTQDGCPTFCIKKL